MSHQNTSYIALLRGVNVGGKAKIKMSDLVEVLMRAGLTNVRTYIQSGNVIFESEIDDLLALERRICDAIFEHFGFAVDVVVLSSTQWQQIIDNAPTWWGNREDWKHNLLILLRPYSMPEVILALGELKPEIEAMQAGDGVIYQSMSIKLFGRTTTGKLAASPIYKRITIRSYNTAQKLRQLLVEPENLE